VHQKIDCPVSFRHQTHEPQLLSGSSIGRITLAPILMQKVGCRGLMQA
jgi:hypothetical protein